MARKPKQAAEAAVKDAGLTRKEFEKILGEAERARENASEYGAIHATTVKNLAERHALEKTAFGFVRRIKRQEPVRAQGTATAVIKYLHLAGVFDQADAFSDVTAELKALLADLEGRTNVVPASAAVLDDLTGSALN